MYGDSKQKVIEKGARGIDGKSCTRELICSMSYYNHQTHQSEYLRTVSFFFIKPQ